MSSNKGYIIVSDIKSSVKYVKKAGSKQKRIKRLKELLKNLALVHFGAFKGWTCVKTTGDGFIFYTEEDEQAKNLLENIKKLWDSWKGSEEMGIRIVAHCFEKPILWEDIGINSTDKWFNNDLFHPEVNKIFRILHMIRPATTILTEDVCKKLQKLEGVMNHSPDKIENFLKSKFREVYRLPICVLKGILDFQGILSNKKPIWVWEVLI